MVSRVKPLKQFGQNFLISDRYADTIIDLLHCEPDDTIIEIGAGKGVLTQRLIKKEINSIFAIEIDPRLVDILEQRFKNKISVIHKSILDVSIAKIDLGKGLKIVGNIPYYLTSKILFKIFEAGSIVKIAVLMVQKEVANRLIANPSSKAYSQLTVWTQYHKDVKKITDVDKENFNPMPEVDSAIITLEPKSRIVDVKDYQLFRTILQKSFQQRRKVLNNSIKGILKSRDIQDIKAINIFSRPEELSVDDFINLSNEISSYTFN